jgi:hypothetical protein
MNESPCAPIISLRWVVSGLESSILIQKGVVAEQEVQEERAIDGLLGRDQHRRPAACMFNPKTGVARSGCIARDDQETDFFAMWLTLICEGAAE